MDFIVAGGLFVTIATLSLVNFVLHNTRTGTLINKIPGPRRLPIIGNFLDLVVPLEDLWSVLRKYSNVYYSTYKLWLFHWPVVSIRHPDDIEILLGTQRNLSKSVFYDLLRPWLNEGLLTSTGTKWRQRRKMLTPAFHFRLLHDFVGVFAETGERMVNTLKEEGGVVVKDVFPFLAKFSLNAVCETAMGTVMGENDPSQDRYRMAVKKMGEYVYYRGTRPWLKSDWIFSLTEMGRKQAADLEILHRFTTDIIVNRKKFHEKTGGKYLKILSPGNEATSELSVSSYDTPLKWNWKHHKAVKLKDMLELYSHAKLNKKRLAMLDLLIAVQKEQGIIDDLGIREEVDTFIFEGHDTTNMGLCFGVLLLAENKDIQARARAEIGSVLKESNGKLGMDELQNLTYLDCCVKETLRLFPSVPHISRLLTEDVKLRKFIVPSGTNLVAHLYDVHRDPNFWPQPEVFDPDRFLPERMKGRHPYSYVPFSAGPRNCIGQKFAMLELKTFIGLILHNFYLEPMIKTSAVHMLPDLVLRSLHPLNVRFVPIQS